MKALMNDREHVLVVNMETARTYACDPSLFQDARSMMAADLLETDPFNAGTWQALDVSSSRLHDTYEMLNVTLHLPYMPQTYQDLVEWVKPDLPWAEDHFQERVSGEPMNPGEAEAYWPYHNGHGDLHKREKQIYDHNYMERMWCRQLSYLTRTESTYRPRVDTGFSGYRFEVGDLGSVVEQLKRDRGTRQAFLPIWFPEDTGATQGQRVPCSLGYHFIIRDDEIHLVYFLRSVEIYRHFHNDVYLACRLAEWVASKLDDVGLGSFTMHMTSFHGFVGDTGHIERIANVQSA